jgi:hypothetical protein
MLEEKGMLVRLSIGQWTANRKDKTVTQEVATNHNSDADMGIYRKALVAKNGLKAVQSAAGDARTFHYTNTLPWNDNGDRILPAANFFIYRQEIDKLKKQFETAVQDIINNYDEMIADARIRLNGLFDSNDYPSKYELERKYYFTVDISPIPTSADFRLTLTNGEEEAIKEEIQNRLQTAAQKANLDAWKRLYETVARFGEVLPAFDPAAAGKDRGTFRDSLVGNAVELCDLLTRLNITDDPELERMRKEVENKLTAYSAKELREDTNARKEVTKDAEAILAAMKPFIS